MVARYNRRDLFEHWVRREQPADRPCTHACCRGYRTHPEHYPVVLPRRTLRHASDEDLAQHFAKVSARDTPADRRATIQVLHEMERRDRAEQHKQAVAAGRAARQMEREAEVERIYLEAEAYTRGNWVNPAGQAAGVFDREILTGRQAVFDRYASEEAREFFRSTPRPTAGHFRGKDTTYQGVYTQRKRRRVNRRAFATRVWGDR